MTPCVVAVVASLAALGQSHLAALGQSAARHYAAGNVVALYHAFAHGGEPLRGFFRSLPCDDASVFLGPSSLGAPPLGEEGPASNCYLSESVDGGRTQRLLAVDDISAGHLLTVPGAFSGSLDVGRALLQTKDTDACKNDCVREAGGGRGRGVFARTAYAKGALVESWPCHMVPDEDVPKTLKDYVKTSPKLGTSLVVFGTGMLHNHGVGEAANLMWSVPTDLELLLTGDGTLQFYARRDVALGEELLEDYGDEYWHTRGLVPL